MARILRFLGFNRRPDEIVLDKAEKRELSSLSAKRFDNLDPNEQERVLELGAKDFSRKFSGVIQELSRE
jgi:hypothetical protein